MSRLWCWFWGHAVHNEAFRRGARVCTRCGRPMLRDDGAVVRVGHTLSCFLFHHTYQPVGQRDGHAEYVCVRCGHPLLLSLARDSYSGRGVFKKRVRYLCGLFGHRVHRVVERSGGTEYACDCGHTFVRRAPGEALVRHPMTCVFLGHRIEYMDRRNEYSEYACRTCGHPFLFKSAHGVARFSGAA